MTLATAPAPVPTEWYDNSLIDRILTCARKAYYTQFYLGGVEDSVGPGARLGTCFHAGAAAYSEAYGRPISDRKLIVTRAFSRTYAREFPTPCEPPRDFENSLAVMLDYCDWWSREDILLKPIEAELGIKLIMRPEPGDLWDFEPFMLKMKIDGTYLRVESNQIVTRETKSASSNVRATLERLFLSRQVRSYAYGLSRALEEDQRYGKGYTFFGTLADIILVAKTKRDFQRDWITPTKTDLWQWRQATIFTVEQWRRRIGRALWTPLATQLAVFEQDPQRCTDYGRCSFYEACKHGLELLENRPRNVWDPLANKGEADGIES